MANECLVTKLKGTVDNNNLPIFGKASFNTGIFTEGAEFVNLLVAAGANPIKVTSVVPMYFEINPEITYTELTVPANTIWAMRILRSNLQIPIENVITIDNMYDCKVFVIDNATRSSYVNYSNKNNIASLAKYSEIEEISLDYDNMVDVNDNLTWMTLFCNNTPSVLDIDKYLDLPNLNALCLKVPGNEIYKQFYLNKNINNSPLVYLMGRPVGPITYLPKNLELINIASNVTGTIEEWVANMVAKGRTQGKCALLGGIYNTTLTYNNKSIQQHLNDGTIPIAFGLQVIAVSWNGATITWLDSSQWSGSGLKTQIPDAYSFYTERHNS